MLFSCAIVSFALALVGGVQATPLATATTAVSTSLDAVNVADGLPILELVKDSVTEHPNVTAGVNGIHASSVDAATGSTLYLCGTTNCASCTGYNLDFQQHNMCLTGNFYFSSIYIYQPSGAGLPFAVGTGPFGCKSFAQVPAVNTCYSTTGYTGYDFVLSP